MRLCPRSMLLALALVVAVAASALAEGGAPASADSTQARAARQLKLENVPWSGDFDGMFERRLIRVRAPFSRTFYFNDLGHERGLAAEFVRDFERYINTKYKKKLQRRPITVVITPATRDRLLPGLADGLADIVVGGLTVTPERLKTVDMVSPEGMQEVDEILVTGPRSPAIRTVEDLSGKIVHVRRSSSYYDSLVALNARFRTDRREEVKLVLVPEALEDEDMMEMVAAGLLQAIVVDDFVARIWAPVLPGLVLHQDVSVRVDGHIGWAIRKGNPLLAAELARFYAETIGPERILDYRLRQTARRIRKLRESTDGKTLKRFQETVAIFEKYGTRYDFDPLMLAAQAYQESQLDQSRRSPAGAIGIMQIMPETGQNMAVGDIRNLDPNVHAGTKFMDILTSRTFAGAEFHETDRTLFAFASYNCGPARIARARTQAVKDGFEPNRWFNNVEVAAAKICGAETTTYVRNIFKYYVAYKLLVEAQRNAEAAQEGLGKAPAAGQ